MFKSRIASVPHPALFPSSDVGLFPFGFLLGAFGVSLASAIPFIKHLGGGKEMSKIEMQAQGEHHDDLKDLSIDQHENAVGYKEYHEALELDVTDKEVGIILPNSHYQWRKT